MSTPGSIPVSVEEAWYDAQDDLLETQPTTVAGLLAFIGCLKEKEECHTFPDDGIPVALDTIAASIRAMTAA